MATATKAKDGPVTGKEKIRGTSPSNLHRADTCGRRRNPKPTTPTSPDKNIATTPSEKPVPNYLRPTISSRSDPIHKPLKKINGLQETTQKPSLNRRSSSFDHKSTLSPFNVHKLAASSSSSFRERSIHHHPSSVSPKPITSSLKPISERVTKTIRVVRAIQSPSSASKTCKTTVKKTTTLKKEGGGEKMKKLGPTDADIDEALSAASEHEERESLMGDVEEELLKVESGIEFPPDTSIPEYRENNNDVDVIANTDYDPKNIEDETLKPCDISTVAEDHHHQTTPPITSPVEEEKADHDTPNGDDQERSVNHHHNVEEKQIQKETEDNSSVEMEENSAIMESKVETDQVKESEENTTNGNLEVKAMEEKEEVVEEGSEVVQKLKEEGGEGGVVEEAAKPKVEKVQGGGGTGKKDSPAYNDVIEETASKLLEKRKNKVKALVGAFETVISLEEA